MKRIVVITIFLLHVPLGGASAWGLPEICAEPPFEAGEMARFEVSIGLLKVGEGAAMLAKTTSLPVGIPASVAPWDRQMWVARGRGISTGLVALFYKVDDALESWMHAGSFLPLYRELRIRETNERALRRVTFDHEEGKTWFWRDRTYYRRRPDKVKVTIRHNPLVPGSLGPVSLFLYLRCLKAEWNGAYEIPVHEDGKNLIVEVRIETIETLNTALGEREALRARIRVLHDGEPKFKRPFWAWVSADERRIPLRFVVDLPFANLKGKVVGYRRNFAAEIEGELDPAFLED